MRHSIRCALAGAAASAGIITLAACPASAAVTSPARHTIVPCDTAALDSAISGAASGDTLVLAAGCTYQTGGLPEISTNLAIVGRGATLEYTFTTAETPIMSVPGGVTVHISNLNFTDGYSVGANASALATQGNVTIDGGTFTGNTAEVGGSAIENTGQLTVRGAAFTDNGGEAATGGAIDNRGQLTVVATTFTGNDTQLYGTSGGAIVNGGQATLRDDTLTGNGADSGAGGAILNDGTLTVVSSTITDNGAATGGGAIYNDGTLTVVSSSVSNNATSDAASDPFGAANGGGIEIAYGTVTLRHDTLSGNSAYSDGGAIYNGAGTLAVVSTSITSNTAGTGGAGGISNKTGTVSLWRDCIMSNTPVNCLNVPGCKG
jgi:predicted outer membrane repeat protein